MIKFDMDDPEIKGPRIIESFRFVLWKLGLADDNDVDEMYITYWDLVKHTDKAYLIPGGDDDEM